MARLKTLPARLAPAPSRLATQTHAGPDRDRARSIAAPWRAWYDLARWKKLRRRVFLRDLFTCQRPECGAVIAETSRLVCDHILPHRGDERLFWDEGNLQTLCKPCHDKVKQAEERRGISREAASRAAPEIPRPRIPVVIVCGPPGSGKSTYVARHKGPNDLVIDLDVIRARLSGGGLHAHAPGFTGHALEERNRMLVSLATDTTHALAWFVVAAPTVQERLAWSAQLGEARVVLMDTCREECLRRIASDPSRKGEVERMGMLVDQWFERAKQSTTAPRD
jgi:5-methylcytosine-specific restriction endonuclease McrA/predicted kinase